MLQASVLVQFHVDLPHCSLLDNSLSFIIRLSFHTAWASPPQTKWAVYWIAKTKICWIKHVLYSLAASSSLFQYESQIINPIYQSAAISICFCASVFEHARLHWLPVLWKDHLSLPALRQRKPPTCREGSPLGRQLLEMLPLTLIDQLYTAMFFTESDIFVYDVYCHTWSWEQAM